MIGMLATGQSQLQHVVNERLDAVLLTDGELGASGNLSQLTLVSIGI